MRARLRSRALSAARASSSTLGRSLIAAFISGLKSFFDFARLEAAGADIGAGGPSVEEHADALEIRVEAPLRGHHRMAPAVTEGRLLSTDCAHLCHWTEECSGSALVQAARGLGAELGEHVGHLERRPHGVTCPVDP